MNSDVEARLAEMESWLEGRAGWHVSPEGARWLIEQVRSQMQRTNQVHDEWSHALEVCGAQRDAAEAEATALREALRAIISDVDLVDVRAFVRDALAGKQGATNA